MCSHGLSMVSFLLRLLCLHTWDSPRILPLHSKNRLFVSSTLRWQMSMPRRSLRECCGYSKTTRSTCSATFWRLVSRSRQSDVDVQKRLLCVRVCRKDWSRRRCVMDIQWIAVVGFHRARLFFWSRQELSMSPLWKGCAMVCARRSCSSGLSGSGTSFSKVTWRTCSSVETDDKTGRSAFRG